MTEKPRTKASYAKPLGLVPFRSPTPSTNRYSVLASSSQSYSQATQKWSPGIFQNQTKISPPSLNTAIPEMCRPSSSRPPSNPYISKPCFLAVKILESDEMDDNQLPRLSKIFPTKNGKIVQYWSTGYQTTPKTQEYYEFILVDTDSVEITHTIAPNSETVAYSKCKINKFITKDEWGHPYQTRTFSQNFQPPKYNYFDYQEAWFKTFYLKPTDHSWFFSFCPKFRKKIPNWVHNWWIYFGLTKEVLPDNILQAWVYFHDHLKTPFYGNKAIMFSAEFQVPWIIAWDFDISKMHDHQHPPMLERRFRIKWWRNFQSGERLSENNIRLWLVTHDNLRQFPKSEKNQNLPAPSKTPTKKEIKKKLLEELSQLGDSDEDEDIGSSQPEQIGSLMQFAQDPYEDYDLT